jgi:hypothetical protein
MSAENDLDSPKRLQEQQWEWRVERTGWLVICVLLIASLAGLLGPGLFSRRTAQSSDSNVQVQYEAVERYEAPATLHIVARPAAQEDGRLRIAISRSFADRVTIDQVVPSPATVESTQEKIFYVFQTQGQTDMLRVVMRYKHNDYGWRRYEIGVGDGEPALVRQFVWP